MTQGARIAAGLVPLPALGAVAPPADARPRRCVRRDQLVALKYTHGGQIFIPARVACGGTLPVIIMLHGNNRSLDKYPSLGGGRRLDKIVGQYIRKGLVRPVVLAEPVHHGACDARARRAGMSPVFGGSFSFSIYKRKLTRLLLKKGIRVSSWSIVGHSGAGCCAGSGLFAAANVFPRLFLWGTSDSCYSSPYYANFIHRRFYNTRTRVVNICRGKPGYPKYPQYEEKLVGKRAKAFHCDRTYYQRCVRHPLRRFYAYVTKPRTVRSHRQVFKEFMKTILFRHFRRRRRRR